MNSEEHAEFIAALTKTADMVELLYGRAIC
jgi:hypothetical protein